MGSESGKCAWGGLTGAGRRGLFTSAIVCVAALTACGEKPDQAAREMVIQPGNYTPSNECASCHRDIHAGWASSVHASAAQNAIFRQAMDDAKATGLVKAEELCDTCHSPASVYGAKNLDHAASDREGIGCDFCHSITAVDLKRRERPYTLEFGPVKRGPIKDAASMAHMVEFSDLHIKSQMCAGCHEYTTDYGAPILSTYSEWQDSSYYKDGINCQRCHMPYVLADVVDPRVKRVADVAVNLHQIPGGHSRQMMYKAFKTSIASVNREKKKIKVSVSISNTGAGHFVPTGMPTRKVILSVDITSEKGEQQQKEVVYERQAAGSQGQPIQRDADLFTQRISIKSDTRIKPGETRTESFEFEDYPGENVTIRARLTYLYSPHGKTDTESRFDFYNEEKHLVSQFLRKPI